MRVSVALLSCLAGLVVPLVVLSRSRAGLASRRAAAPSHWLPLMLALLVTAALLRFPLGRRLAVPLVVSRSLLVTLRAALPALFPSPLALVPVALVGRPRSLLGLRLVTLLAVALCSRPAAEPRPAVMFQSLLALARSLVVR